MDKHPKIRKSLVLGIFFLLFGIAVIPSSNPMVVEVSNHTNLVKVTTQVCDFEGFVNTTIKLTREQYENLEQYLIEFRERLNLATTKQEMIPIFKEMVVELDKFGLLPKAITVEQAQNLVTGRYENHLVVNFYTSGFRGFQLLNNSNFFSLIAGDTTHTRLHSFFETGCSVLSYFLFVIYMVGQMLSHDSINIINIVKSLQAVSNFYHKVNTIRIIGTGEITFGCSYSSNLPPPYRYEPAEGWVTTLGLFGKKSWNGSFFGRIIKLATFDSYIYYIGAIGFLGIKLTTDIEEQLFFFGCACYVKID